MKPVQPRLAASAVPAVWTVLAALTAFACRPADDAAASLLITETGVVACSHTSDIYTNHTTSPRDLHVKVTSGCIGRDTLAIDSARVWVRDAQGGVYNRQDVRIGYQQTHRGTFTVPGGASLRVECPDSLFRSEDGCSWEYRYVLGP